ncbi:MAG: T9SS type A sorting domain-containing protein [Ginsengibacter sp.]
MYIFTALNKIFYIFILFTILSTATFAQSDAVAKTTPAVRIIRFFPNPAVSTINFEFEKGFDRSYTFDIYNFIGKKVFSVKSVTSKMNVSLTEFIRGVYIYQLRDRSGKIIESAKFQVVK